MEAYVSSALQPKSKVSKAKKRFYSTNNQQFVAEPHSHEYTKLGVRTLYQKAIGHAGNSPKAKCSYLYRNKNQRYFENIINANCIMNPYLKDVGNDPLNPMNKRLGGLFFMASVKNKSGEVHDKSPFGNTRLMIPVENLMQDMKLYFADFFCLRGRKHYVTLVACKPDTKTDLFCQNKLVEINCRDNRFFSLVGSTDYEVLFRRYLCVHIVITQPINLRKEMYSIARSSYIFFGVPIVGRGSSRNGRSCKNNECRVCNIITFNSDSIQVRSEERAIEPRFYARNSLNKFTFTEFGKYTKAVPNDENHWLVLSPEHSQLDCEVEFYSHAVTSEEWPIEQLTNRQRYPPNRVIREEKMPNIQVLTSEEWRIDQFTNRQLDPPNRVIGKEHMPVIQVLTSNERRIDQFTNRQLDPPNRVIREQCMPNGEISEIKSSDPIVQQVKYFKDSKSSNNYNNKYPDGKKYKKLKCCVLS